MRSLADIATAIDAVAAELQRRPERAIDDDLPAVSRWEGGARIVATRRDGLQVQTDMPTVLAGSGDQVSAGWLFRASLGACLGTTVVMRAATQGIALTALEVVVGSHSDTRGLLGLSAADGSAFPAGPLDMTVAVRISADGVSADTLRALVEGAVATSPVSSLLKAPPPLTLQVEVA